VSEQEAPQMPVPIIKTQPLPTSIVMNVVPGTMTEQTPDGPKTTMVKWIHVMIFTPTGHTEIFLQPNDVLDVIRQFRHQVRVARTGIVLPDGVFLPDDDGFHSDEEADDAEG